MQFFLFSKTDRLSTRLKNTKWAGTLIAVKRFEEFLLSQFMKGSCVCNITKVTEKFQVLQECQVIVWDEGTIAHKNALQALNQTLQFLRGNDLLMGGVTVALSGDFRQTLPVIPKENFQMADEIKACLKSSHLWRHVQTLRLTTNMRVHQCHR